MNSNPTIEVNDKCVKFFFDQLSQKDLAKAERNGLMHGAKIIEQATKRMIVSRWPAATSTKHGRPIIEGLYKKVQKSNDGRYYAMVSIMGEPKKRKVKGNRGGLLRYFEVGTQERYRLGNSPSEKKTMRIMRRLHGNDILKNNPRTGRISAVWFFRDAKTATKPQVFDAMRDKMSEKLEEAVAKAIAKANVGAN